MKAKIQQVIILALVASIAGLVSGKARAEPKGDTAYKTRMEMWEEKMSAVFAEIGLSPEQETALKTNRETHRARMSTIYEEIRQKREEIHQELQKPDFDVTRVKHLHGELKSLKMQREDNRLEGILAVRSILSTEQFRRFLQVKEQYKAKMREERK